VLYLGPTRDAGRETVNWSNRRGVSELRRVAREQWLLLVSCQLFGGVPAGILEAHRSFATETRGVELALDWH
jgi:hypothetical protein